MQVAGPATRGNFQEAGNIAIGGFETGNQAIGQARDAVDTVFASNNVISILVDESDNRIVP